MKIDKVLRNMHEHIESNLPAPPVAIKYWKEAFEEAMLAKDAEIQRLQQQCDDLKAYANLCDKRMQEVRELFKFSEEKKQ